MEAKKQLHTKTIPNKPKDTSKYKLRWANERILKLRDRIKELNKYIRRLKKYEKYYNWHVKYQNYFYQCKNMTDENNIIKRIKAKEKQDKEINNKPPHPDAVKTPKKKNKLFYHRKFY